MCLTIFVGLALKGLKFFGTYPKQFGICNFIKTSQLRKFLTIVLMAVNYFFEVYISTVQKVSELKFRIEVRMNPQF